MFCDNQSEVPLQFAYLSHMIRIISTSLISGQNSTISTIIKNTKYIFTLDYKGLLILIPLYVNQIESILKSKSDFNSNTKISALTLLGSLLCIPYQYPNYEISSVIKGGNKTKMEEVKYKIQNIIWNFIHETSNQLQMIKTESDPNLKSTVKIMNKAICYSIVLVYQEASRPKPQSDLIQVFKNIT